MSTYVASDGNWGDASDLRVIDIPLDQVEAFGERSDTERWWIAEYMSQGCTFLEAVCLERGWHDSGDNPVDPETGAAECEDCGEEVNAVPDCGDPDPKCAEHNGACD